jgi:hypothetical protein
MTEGRRPFRFGTHKKRKGGAEAPPLVLSGVSVPVKNVLADLSFDVVVAEVSKEF